MITIKYAVIAAVMLLVLWCSFTDIYADDDGTGSGVNDGREQSSDAHDYKHSITYKIPITIKFRPEEVDIDFRSSGDGAPMPEVAILPAGKRGHVEYDITYSEPGVYHYTIRQQHTKNGDMTMKLDDTVYNVVVSIVEEPGYGFRGSVVIYMDGHDDKPEEIMFDNAPPNEKPPVEDEDEPETPETKKKRIIDTGDTSPLEIWLLIFGISVFILIEIYIIRRPVNRRK